MEFEESIGSIFYMFLFAVFLTVAGSQSKLFQTTVTGLDTLSEFQTDLINDFTYSPCFVAKNKQGNNIHGVFDTDLLDDHTTRKKISEIVTNPPMSLDYPINYAPTTSNCLNTKDNYYYYEIRENATQKTIWLFGNGSRLGFTYDKTWTHGKKPITIKRDDITSSGIIIYGFSKNPPKAGSPFSITTIGIVAPTNCESSGGITCAIGERCDGGSSSNIYSLPITIPIAPTLTTEDSKSLDDYTIYRPDGPGTATYAKCSNNQNSPDVFGFFKKELIGTSAFGPKLDELKLLTTGRAFYMYYEDGTDKDNNNICFTNPTEYYTLESDNSLKNSGINIPAGAYYCNEHNMVIAKTCTNGCSTTNPGYCNEAPPSTTTTPTLPTTGGITLLCCFDGGTCI